MLLDKTVATSHSLSLTVHPSSPDAQTDDAGDPVQEFGGEEDGERLVEEHALGETLKEGKRLLV